MYSLQECLEKCDKIFKEVEENEKIKFSGIFITDPVTFSILAVDMRFTSTGNIEEAFGISYKVGKWRGLKVYTSYEVPPGIWAEAILNLK